VQQAMKADAAMQSLKVAASHEDYPVNALTVWIENGNEDQEPQESPCASRELTRSGLTISTLSRYNER